MTFNVEILFESHTIAINSMNWEPPYGYNVQICSIYRPTISIYTSNISVYRTIKTIAIVKTLLPIVLDLLLPLYYHDSTIAKVTIAMHR